MKEERVLGLEAIGILRELPDQPISNVWDHVSRVEVDGKHVITCNHCGATKKCKQLMASRCALHLVAQCEKVDEDVSKQVYESHEDSLKAVKEAGQRRHF